jgi:hypothetical protein
MEVAILVVVCIEKCSLVKQVLHVGQFVAIGAHVFCLGLIRAKIGKTIIWKGPSHLGQIAPFQMGTSIWRNVV